MHLCEYCRVWSEIMNDYIYEDDAIYVYTSADQSSHEMAIDGYLERYPDKFVEIDNDYYTTDCLIKDEETGNYKLPD